MWEESAASLPRKDPDHCCYPTLRLSCFLWFYDPLGIFQLDELLTHRHRYGTLDFGCAAYFLPLASIMDGRY